MRSVLVLPLVFVVGCATALDAARGTLATSAHAVVQADQAFGTAYAVASENARNASLTQEDKDEKMIDWTKAADAMEKVLDLARASLVAAEVALDGFERTGEQGYYDEAIACVAETLRGIAKVLEERGLKIPAALAKVLTLSAGLMCAGGSK